MDSGIVFLFAGVLILAAALLAVVVFLKKTPAGINVEKYRVSWLTIEQSLVKDNTSSYHLAVLNADKLVDKALQERQIRGQTMGERMKSYNARWSQRNQVWSAHKLRNRIAHESDVTVSYNDARRALSAFKTALKDLGAI